jgi:uncharacterized repeat protein (TIGR03803 family)
MKNTLQHQNWISRMRLPAASAALALAALLVLAVITTQSAQAQTLTTLHSFDDTRGSDPWGGLVQAWNGDLYGTTAGGGSGNGINDVFLGTVFKITRSGTLTSLFSFGCGTNGVCPGGEQPRSTLVQAANGDLYGTTPFGGLTSGYGTIFKINPSGTLTHLFVFFCSTTNCPSGAVPEAGLIQATDGSFYGTTSEGGNTGFGTDTGGGTVFKFSAGGLTTLYTFCSQSNCNDGAYPYAGLVQAANGDLYGTTTFGGTGGIHSGDGTVFKITPSGTLTTLYNFCSQSNCTDGAVPYAGLIQANDGNLYGTTSVTDIGSGSGGTVFKITHSGELTTLYTFCSQSNCTDGSTPTAGLVQAADGNFYGTTEGGGNNTCEGGCGTIFKITPSGALTTLYTFCSQSNCTDGAEPYAGLVQDTNGRFYGTTYEGGVNQAGTVFTLSVGLRPFVKTQPSSGQVGAAIQILGSNLTGATSVTFNGTASTFTVVSASQITTTVPAGATTGKVQVVIPGGTLSSNVNFRVAP